MIDKPEMEQHLQDFSELVCRHVPEGFEVVLTFRHDKAFVNLLNQDEDYLVLPEGDKTLVAQINDALCVANGLDN